MSINPWPTSHVPDGLAWCCTMLWEPVWFNLPFTWCKSSILLLPPLRASSMLYGWSYAGGLQLFHQLFAAHSPSYLTQRFRTLIRQPKVLLCCLVFVRLDPLEPFDIVLLHQQWFLDSNSALLAWFTESSPHSGRWHCFSCVVVFRAVSLLSCNPVTLMKLCSALFAAFYLPALFLVFFPRRLQTV